MIKLKDLLLESRRYEQEVLTQSRFIINQFKNSLSSGKNLEIIEDGSIPSKYQVDYDEDEILETDGFIYYDLALTIKVDKKNKLIGEGLPYHVYGEADESTLVIDIIYHPKSFPESMNDLIATIKDTLRHELEHIAQFNLFGKEDYEYHKDNLPFYKYLMLRHETPAFVKGLYKAAKTKRISLYQAMDDFFDEYIDEFNSKEEINIVRDLWTKYAQENIPTYK
jgi:hypothetical protein